MKVREYFDVCDENGMPAGSVSKKESIMSYTDAERDLITKWRPYYPKMIKDAIDQVVLEELQFVKPYIVWEFEKNKNSLLMKAAEALDKKNHNYDDEKQKEIDASLLEDRLRNPQKAFYYMEQAKKDFPDRVEEIEALSKLYIALDIMKSTSTISADGWLLHVLKYFYELYQQYPDISDANALIQFIKKEEVIKSAEELDLLPQETRERLDLNFSENLKPFIEQYALTIATKADNILQNTEHSNSVNQFKERVAKDSDGFYRWIYDRKERNPDMKWYLRVLFMKFFKRIVLLFGVMWVLSMIYSTLIIWYTNVRRIRCKNGREFSGAHLTDNCFRDRYTILDKY